MVLEIAPHQFITVCFHCAMLSDKRSDHAQYVNLMRPTCEDVMLQLTMQSGIYFPLVFGRVYAIFELITVINLFTRFLQSPKQSFKPRLNFLTTPLLVTSRQSQLNNLRIILEQLLNAVWKNALSPPVDEIKNYIYRYFFV